jgi:hypothetical protein
MLRASGQEANPLTAAASQVIITHRGKPVYQEKRSLKTWHKEHAPSLSSI